MKRRFCLFAFIVLSVEIISFSSYSQRLVTGKLVDKDTDKPINEATIKLIGTNIETKVNALGYFQLQIDSIDQISISSPGYDFAEMVLPKANSFKFVMTKAVAPPEEKRMYLDRFGFPVDKVNATSYRVVYQYPMETSKFLVKEYDLNNRMTRIATFSDKDIYSKDGYCTSFFESGQRSDEGFYSANLKVGSWKKWYGNGKLKEESFYERSTLGFQELKITNFFDSLGNALVSNGNGEYHTEDDDSKMYGKGLVQKGLKTGKWIGYFKNGQVAYEEEYKDGNLIKGLSYDSLGKEYTYEKIMESDMDEIYQFVAKNIKYPAEAKRIGIQGKVVVHFVTDSEGKILKSRIAKGVEGGCNEEALRVVLKYDGKWRRGKRRGQPLKMNAQQSFYLPIAFKLG